MELPRGIAWLVSLSLSTSVFAGSVTISGKEIRYEWKDKETIWYEPTYKAKDTTTEEYDLCKEEFSTDRRWTIKPRIFGSPPCTLVPDQSAVWVHSYANDLLEMELKASKKVGEEQLKAAHQKMTEDYEKNCPPNFKIIRSYTVKANKSAIVCIGKPSLKCKDGFQLENDEATCTKTVHGGCPDSTVPHPQESFCQSCVHGGTIDTDEKRTTTVCSHSGACSTRFYCKVKLDIPPG